MDQIHNNYYKARTTTDTAHRIRYLHRVSRLLAQDERPTRVLLDLDFCGTSGVHLHDDEGESDRTVKALIVNILRLGVDAATVVGPMPPDVQYDLITLRSAIVAGNVLDGVLLFLISLVRQLKENNDSLEEVDQQVANLADQSSAQTARNPELKLEESDRMQEQEQQLEATGGAAIALLDGAGTDEPSRDEISDISIIIHPQTQDNKLGRADLSNLAASESPSQLSELVSPSPLADVDDKMLGLHDIADLQHKRYTEEKHRLLKSRATLLDDIVSLLYFLENLFAVQAKPLARTAGTKSSSKALSPTGTLFNNYRGYEDGMFKSLLTISLGRNLPQLLVILINLVTTDILAGIAAPLLRLLTVLVHTQSLHSIKSDTTQPLLFRTVDGTSSTKQASHRSKKSSVKLNITGTEQQGHMSRTDSNSSSKMASSELLSSLELPPILSKCNAQTRISRHAVIAPPQSLLRGSMLTSSDTGQRGGSVQQNIFATQRYTIRDMMQESYYFLCRKNAPRKPLGDTFMRLHAVKKGSDTGAEENVHDLFSGLSSDSGLMSDIDSVLSDDGKGPAEAGRSSTLTSAKTIPAHKIPITPTYISQPPVFTHCHRTMLDHLLAGNKLLGFVTYCADHISSICQAGLSMQQGFSKKLQYTKLYSVETDAQLTNTMLCCLFILAAQAAAHTCFSGEKLSDADRIEALGQEYLVSYIEKTMRVLNATFEGLQRNSGPSMGFNDHNNWYVRNTGLCCFYWIAELVYILGASPLTVLGKRLMSLAEEKNNSTLMRTLPAHVQELAAESLKNRLKSENERLYKAMPVLQAITLPLRMSISCLHTLSHMLETWAPYKGSELQGLCFYAQLLMTEDRLHSTFEALSIAGEKTFSIGTGFATKSVTGKVLTLDESSDSLDVSASEVHLNLNDIGAHNTLDTEACTIGMFLARQISGTAFVGPLLIFADSVFDRLTFGSGQDDVCTAVCKILALLSSPEMDENGQTLLLFGTMESILVLLSFLEKPATTAAHHTLHELSKRILDIVFDPVRMTSISILHLFKPTKVIVCRTPFFKHEAQKLERLLVEQFHAGSAYHVKARHQGVRYEKTSNMLVINPELVTKAALSEIFGDLSVTNTTNRPEELEPPVNPAAVANGVPILASSTPSNSQVDLPSIELTSTHNQQRAAHNIRAGNNGSDKDDLSSESTQSGLNEKLEDDGENDESGAAIEDTVNYTRHCDSGFTAETNRMIVTFIKESLDKGIGLEDVMGTLMIELDCQFTVAQLIEQWKKLSVKEGRFSAEEDAVIKDYIRKHGGLNDVLINEIAAVMHRNPQAIRRRISSLQSGSGRNSRSGKRRIKM